MQIKRESWWWSFPFWNIMASERTGSYMNWWISHTSHTSFPCHSLAFRCHSAHKSSKMIMWILGGSEFPYFLCVYFFILPVGQSSFCWVSQLVNNYRAGCVLDDSDVKTWFNLSVVGNGDQIIMHGYYGYYAIHHCYDGGWFYPKRKRKMFICVVPEGEERFLKNACKY